MFKFIQPKSFKVLTVGCRTYSTLASNNYNSFIVVNGIKFYQTTFNILRENGYKNFDSRKKYLKKDRLKKRKKNNEKCELRMAA